MIKIAVGNRKVITSSFVDGRLCVVDAGMTLESRIKEYPMEVLQKIIQDGTQHHNNGVCDKCIDRMYELKQYAEMAKMLKLRLQYE